MKNVEEILDEELNKLKISKTEREILIEELFIFLSLLSRLLLISISVILPIVFPPFDYSSD